jgi:hypothetical protein
MSKCIRWGQQTIQTCQQWADQGANVCTQWADQGSNECSQWAGANQCTQWGTQSSSQCSSWSSWWSWLCLAVVTIVTSVCVASVWVANAVCQATIWVANLVCQVAMWIAKWVCVAVVISTIPICLVFEMVIWPFIKSLIFGILAPFAAAIDAVCQSCDTQVWVKDHFGLKGQPELISKVDSVSSPGDTDYVFICHCNPWHEEEITFTASTEEEALVMVKEKCADACK